MSGIVETKAAGGSVPFQPAFFPPGSPWADLKDVPRNVESKAVLAPSAQTPPAFIPLKSPWTDINALLKNIKLDVSAEILSRYLRKEGPIQTILASYDYFLDERLPKLLGRYLYPQDGERLWISDVRYSRVKSDGDPDEKEGPLFFMKEGGSYEINVWGRWHHERYFNGQWVLPSVTSINPGEETLIMQIPLMLGSKRCWTRKGIIGPNGMMQAGGEYKSDEELLRVGLSPIDPFACFIINGRRRIINCSEKLMFDKIVVAPFIKLGTLKGLPAARVTVNMRTGTQRISVQRNYTYIRSRTSSGAISQRMLKPPLIDEIGVNIMGIYTRIINVYRMYRILMWTPDSTLVPWGVKDFDSWSQETKGLGRPWDFNGDWVAEFDNIVKSFLIKPAKSKKSLGELDVAKLFFQSDRKSDVDYVNSLKSPLLATETVEGKEAAAAGLFRTMADVQAFVNTNLFANIDEIYSDPRIRRDIKIAYLAEMTARYSECLSGLIPWDDRDAWYEKRVDTPGRLIDHLVSSSWNGYARKFREGEYHKKTVALKFWPSELRKSVGKDITDSFSGNNWGSSVQMNRRENIILDQLLETPVVMYTQLLYVRPPLSARRGQREARLRAIQPSQLGFIDIVFTPEDEQVGLIKALALLVMISHEQEEMPVLSSIRKALTLRDASTSIDAESVRVYLNGKYLGWHANGKVCREEFLSAKRSGKLGRLGHEITHGLESKQKSFHIFCNGGRILRPLAIAKNGKVPLFDDWAQLQNRTLTELASLGYVDFVDPLEQQTGVYTAESVAWIGELKKTAEEYEKRVKGFEDKPIVAKNAADLNLRKMLVQHQRFLASEAKANYTELTHCEIDPQSVMGAGSAQNPLINFEAAPRGVFQTKMSTHALGCIPEIEHSFDASMKVLFHPERPYFETQMSKEIGLDRYPVGQMVVVGIKVDDDDQEDGIVVNEESQKNGLFRYIKYITVKEEVRKIKKGDTKKGDIPIYAPTSYEGANRNLEPTGVVRIGAIVKPKDVLLNRFKVSDDGTRQPNPVVVPPYEGEDVGDTKQVSWVERIERRDRPDKVIYLIRIATLRSYGRGDKLAARYAQKGLETVSRPSSRMPTLIIDGKPVKVDLLINPHAIPSRMTLGLLIEIILSTAGVLSGKRIDATSFRHVKLEEAQEILRENGYDENMAWPAINPILSTPEKTVYYENKIVGGPIYYQALPHHAMDKFQVRSVGRRTMRVHQPLGHRQTPGGSAQRFGNQEADATMSHGAVEITRERLCVSSDGTPTAVCQSCNQIVSVRLGEQPSEIRCRLCQTNTRIGRTLLPFATITTNQVFMGMGFKISYGTVPPGGTMASGGQTPRTSNPVTPRSP